MTQSTPQTDHNLLVVSDLHLGEDLRPGGTGMSYLRHLVKLEREFEKFLRHHTERRDDGRPWRLVVNGDMVDFMSMKILPEADVAGIDPSIANPSIDEDRLYGLGFDERAAQKKLERVIVRHRGVFTALGEFVCAGNELVIIVGNHDVEFHYDMVQRTFVEWLSALSLGVGAADGIVDQASQDERAAFVARVQFCPWFYYQENCIYIEHGHQFDEYCAFDFQLNPVPLKVPEPAEPAPEAAPVSAGPAAQQKRGARPRRSKSRFAISMAHAGMRYFANQIPEYDPHTAEHWGIVNYVKWASALGFKGMSRICYLYGLLVWKVVEAWYAMRADHERRQIHLIRLRALSHQWRLTEDKLHGLAALHRVPVTRRFFGVLRALFVDRVLLGGFSVGVALALFFSLQGPLRYWAPLATLAVCLGINDLLGRLRLESSAERLRSVPTLVQALVGAPLIVFGHSHAPERVALPNGAVYFNTGTWASDDAALAFTHLVVSGADDSRCAELRQWRDGVSAPFVLRDTPTISGPRLSRPTPDKSKA